MVDTMRFYNMITGVHGQALLRDSSDRVCMHVKVSWKGLRWCTYEPVEHVKHLQVYKEWQRVIKGASILVHMKNNKK